MAMDFSSLSASVVGGGVGGRLSLNALQGSPHFNMVAAADLRPEIQNSLERDFPGLRTFASHEEMLAQCPTDVVCVSTYAPSHEPIVLNLLKLPSLRGILVEKPLADSAAAGRRILDAVRARGLPMVVPHGLRARSLSDLKPELNGSLRIEFGSRWPSRQAPRAPLRGGVH